VRWADRHIKGGLGIMLDDLLAAVYAVLVLAALQAIGGVSGVRR
jgi:phosphatidylglycerophosphatase A